MTALAATPTPPTPILGKTQQRAVAVVDLLRSNPRKQYTYAELTEATQTPYDALLYMLHALAEVGVVTKHETPEGPGRPRVAFQWARASGTRKS